MAVSPIESRAGERVYHEIKGAILAGDLRLRQRLDIETLARKLRVSATPVRQVLAILAVERLVRVEAARGYYVAFWSERELSELYLWRGALARIAAENYQPPPAPLTTDVSYVELYDTLMQHLQRDAWREVRLASLSADERLRPALRAEPEALKGAAADLEGLAAALSRPDKRALARLLQRHFQRRAAEAAAIRAGASIAALPRNGD